MVDYDADFEIMHAHIQDACQKQRTLTVISKELPVCPVCMDYLKETGPNDPDRPTRLENCDDVVHRSCLHEHYLSAINENKFPVKCVNYECDKFIAHLDIQKVLSVDEYERFIRFLTKAMKLDMEGAIDCPNLECDFFFDNGGNEKPDYFRCLKCENEYCL